MLLAAQTRLLSAMSRCAIASGGQVRLTMPLSRGARLGFVHNSNSVSCSRCLSVLSEQCGKQARLTNKLRSSKSLPEIVQKLSSVRYSDGVELHVVHMSAAWVCLAEGRAQRAQHKQDSEEFASLISMTASALNSPDTRWRQSVQKVQNHSSGKVGHPAALVLWSVAVLHGVWPKARRLVDPLAKHMRSAIPVLHVQNVSNAIWAFGVMHVEGDNYNDIVTNLVYRAIDISSDMKSQHVSNLCWGLARRKHASRKLCSKMVSRMLSLSSKMSRKAIGFDLTQTACAFAALNFRSDDFMSLVSDKVGGLIARHPGSALPDWNLCAVQWAFDQLYPEPSQTNRSDGVWKNQGTIKGNLVIGEGGRIFSLKYIADDAVSLSLGDDGHVDTGRLVGSGTRIQWSDGVIWTRLDPPFTDFRNTAPLHILEKGLAHRVADVLGGPERWYTSRKGSRKPSSSLGGG